MDGETEEGPPFAEASGGGTLRVALRPTVAPAPLRKLAIACTMGSVSSPTFEEPVGRELPCWSLERSTLYEFSPTTSSCWVDGATGVGRGAFDGGEELGETPLMGPLLAPLPFVVGGAWRRVLVLERLLPRPGIVSLGLGGRLPEPTPAVLTRGSSSG